LTLKFRRIAQHKRYTTMPSKHPLRTFSRTLWLISPAFFALWLYAHVLGLPLYLDDAPNFWFVANGDMFAHWAGSEAFRFYRPLTFSVWHLSALFTGNYDAPALHSLNLFAFMLMTTLTSAFVMHVLALANWQASSRRMAGWMAGMVIALYPFTYKTVPLISSAFHVMMVLGVVMALWMALRWAQGKHGAWWWGAILGAFIATFSHENGFLTALFLLPLLWLGRKHITLKRALIVWLPIALISGVYLLLWATVPRQQSPEGLLISYDIPRNLAFLIQGIAPFFASLGRIALPNPAPIAPTVLLMLSAGVLALFLIGKRNLWLGMGLLVAYGIAIAPALLLLFPAYVLDSPRLMLLASVASAMLWGMAFAHQWQRGWLWRVPMLVVVAYAGITALSFHQSKQNDFARLNAYHQDLLSLVPDIANQVMPANLVNAVNSLAPLREHRAYLQGAEGVYLMVDEVEYSQYLWANTGASYPVTLVMDANTLRAQGEIVNPAAYAEWERATPDEVRAQISNGAPIVTTFFHEDGNFSPQLVGQADDIGAGDLPSTSQATFVPADGSNATPALSLWSGEAIHQENNLSITLIWQANQSAPAKRFIHIYCDATFIAQNDGYVWGDMYPFRLWQPEEIQRERRTIYLDRQSFTNPDCLQVYVGVYDENTGTRYQAFAESGERLPDDRWRVLFVQS
jgi:hypothetical protein